MKYLSVMCVCAMVIGCDGTSGPPPELKPPGVVVTGDDMLVSLNQFRTAGHVAPVKRDTRLDRTAAAQAAYCARLGRLTHMGPDGSSPWDRIRAAGVPYPGLDAQENGAAWQSSGAQAVADWAHENPDIGHRRNVYDKRWTHIGYGISTDKNRKRYFFMDFAREP
jgi:uncharacterized protein YkwD